MVWLGPEIKDIHVLQQLLAAPQRRSCPLKTAANTDNIADGVEVHQTTASHLQDANRPTAPAMAQQPRHRQAHQEQAQQDNAARALEAARRTNAALSPATAARQKRTAQHQTAKPRTVQPVMRTKVPRE